MTSLQMVVLAGGSGTRLWPLSRELYPKQFLKLTDSTSPFQQTCLRTQKLCPLPPIVVCNQEHRFLVVEQCRQIDQDWAAIILEPEARNTAPAIALAALQSLAAGADEEPVLLVLPSDHHVPDKRAFEDLVQQALPAALDGQLVTFGITPNKPHTGYGYIRQGEPRADGSFRVGRFEEKPNLENAKAYLSAGDYLWNSGIFCFKPSVYLQELERHQPQMYQACRQAVQETKKDLEFLRPGPSFLRSPAQSIDYAIMEVTQAACVLPTPIEWNDLGSWDALWEVSDKDEDNNVLRGDVSQLDTHNCFVQSEDRLVAAIGLDDLIVVDTSDALLVAAKDRSADVSTLVKRMKSQSRSEPVSHTRVYRPWGSYESIDSGGRYQVKLITVNPGACLSLQKHFHRAEHWIVVHGTALVTCDDSEQLVYENQSTYIPIGSTHRLENPGKLPLELIEVQIGSYLGEDDIVRFEDNYGRSE
ncbi:MAG: mannose-1-phosphate guanylyltransferase/mannose-6-phosphate isomerase [Pseudomonadales bacterium]